MVGLGGGRRFAFVPACVAEPAGGSDVAGHVLAALLLGDQVLGGFFRYSESKSETESLNSPGTQFAKLCMTEADDFDEALACYHGHCSFELYYTIARIACLAMGYEMRNRRLCPPVAPQGKLA